MPPFRVIDIAVLSLVLVSLVAAGCAKRPATATTAAPAPAGQAATTPTGPGRGAPAVTATTPGSTVTPGAPVAPPGGTPATRPSPREFVSVPGVKDIHFDFDRYDIRPDDARILDENSRWMRANPGYLVLIEGHADERGTNEYNLALGERRAKAALNYLVAQGVPAARFTLISYGEERPACRERAETCWARNRRAHFLVKAQ